MQTTCEETPPHELAGTQSGCSMEGAHRVAEGSGQKAKHPEAEKLNPQQQTYPVNLPSTMPITGPVGTYFLIFLP